jgi:hypothetical protein
MRLYFQSQTPLPWRREGLGLRKTGRALPGWPARTRPSGSMGGRTRSTASRAKEGGPLRGCSLHYPLHQEKLSARNCHQDPDKCPGHPGVEVLCPQPSQPCSMPANLPGPTGSHLPIGPVPMRGVPRMRPAYRSINHAKGGSRSLQR